jgi:hypothetical protein
VIDGLDQDFKGRSWGQELKVSRPGDDDKDVRDLVNEQKYGPTNNELLETTQLYFVPLPTCPTHSPPLLLFPYQFYLFVNKETKKACKQRICITKQGYVGYSSKY